MQSSTSEADIFLKTGVYKMMPSADGTLDIQVCTFPSSSSSSSSSPPVEVVFLTGYDEAFVKYWEFFKDFNDRGFTVHTMDHRSQGMSGRSAATGPPTASSNMAYVADFQSYVADAEKYARQVAPPGRKIALLGHSMGGLVSLELVSQLPSLFTCTCVNAPMIEFKSDPWPFAVAGAISGLFCLLGLGPKHSIGFPKPGWEPANLNLPWHVTHDAGRNGTWAQQLAENPGCCLSGPSNQWVRSCYLACSSFVTKFVGEGSEDFPVPYMMVRREKEGEGVDKYSIYDLCIFARRTYACGD